jgi:peptide/nickel transport system substrate-binding protein
LVVNNALVEKKEVAMIRPDGIDWSVLSGPRVSRRTLVKLASATGAVGFAQRLAAIETQAVPRVIPARLPLSRQEPRQGGSLRVGFGQSQIVTLDPALLLQGIVAGSILPVIFSSLVQFDEQLGIIPDLAETWEVSPDGLNYVFTLRPELTFHNGDALAAEDILYTFQRTTKPDLASPHANKLALVESIEAPDELTIAITLTAPFAPFLAVACTRGPGRALTPVSRRALEEMGDDQYGITPVGTGPFKVVPESAKAGQGLDVVAFEEWYGGRPHLDEIKFLLVPEPTSLVGGLEAGDLDFIDPVPTNALDQVAATDGLTVIEVPGTNWRGLAMNYARPPWDSLDARLAVAKAIDRQDLVDRAFLGRAVPAIGAIAPAFAWAYLPPEQVEDPQAYNLDEAKALAERAGLAGATAVAVSTDEINRPTEVIRVALQEIGLEVKVESMQQAAWNERVLAGDYDFVLAGSTVDADPDDGHWNNFHSTGPFNSYDYQSDEADALLEATRETSDQAERTRLFQELQALLQADVAVAFAYHLPDYVAFRSGVQGYVPIPEQRYYEMVWLED